MSDGVQAELEGIFRKAKAHSLDVERKHQQDKASEFQRVLSLAAVSRNSILQRYLLQRSVAVTERIRSRRSAKGNLYSNTRALAIAEQPALFSRGTGRLLWQPIASGEAMRQISHAGD